uniref:Cytochrome c biogenesis protein CcsA n=1 Tax=Hyalogonium fusiforme TaxID=2926373 RepID=A0A9E7V7I4_9CHLO|nr:cytochrome C biogenesis protein [Hyalogonium fusiforme]
MTLQNSLANFSFLSLLGSMIFYWVGTSFRENLFSKEVEGLTDLWPAKGAAKGFGLAERCPEGNSEVPEGSRSGVSGQRSRGSASASQKTPLTVKAPLTTMLKAYGPSKLAQYGIVISNILLGLLLLLRWKESGHFPLSNLYESLMFLSWCFTVIHLFIENYSFPFLFANFFTRSGSAALNTQKEGNNNKNNPTQNQENISNKYFLVGAITTPSALLTNAFATFTLPKEMQEASPLVPALQSNWLMMHVTVMILSYAALIIGSLLSVAFLIVTFEMPHVQGLASQPHTPIKTKATWPKARANSTCNTPLVDGYIYSKALNVNTVLRPLGSASCPKGTSSEAEGPLTKGPSVVAKPLSRRPLPILPSDCPSEIATALVNGNEVAMYHNDGKAGTDSAFTLTKGLQAQSAGNQAALTPLAYMLDNLSYRILGIGFPFLTIGILSGAVWANEAWGSYWSWDPKETWALLTWLIFAIYLHTRLSKGWEGRKPAMIASFGFVIVWVCYLGVNLIGEGLHSYGWLLKVT